MSPLIIIQARLGSTRLPGKVLLPIKGKPMLAYLCERMTHHYVVATPNREISDALFSLQLNGLMRQAAENDVAGRFAEFVDGPTFVRLCGDSPLMDPALIDAAIALYEPPYLEIRSPVGCVEVCDTVQFLEFLPDMTPYDREHVTGLLRPYGQSISVGRGPRLVVDEQADFDRVTAVIEKMDRPHTEYGWRETCALR